MLKDWLAPLPLEQFFTTYFDRAPYARPEAARDAVSRFDWDVLQRVLAAEPAPDVLVASQGRLADAPPPRTSAETRALLARALGVVVRKAERHDDLLAELARDFARDLPGDVHVQLYITPGGTHAFGWHYDAEQVFIVQTRGAKDYYMRANTVSPPGAPGLSPDFSAIRRETSPLSCARLVPGDWLYIPAGWWHLVRSIDDALSISIGVTPRREERPGLETPAVPQQRGERARAH